MLVCKTNTVCKGNISDKWQRSDSSNRRWTKHCIIMENVIKICANGVILWNIGHELHLENTELRGIIRKNVYVCEWVNEIVSEREKEKEKKKSM